MRTAVYVAVTTGLRVSELLALKWAVMDFTWRDSSQPRNRASAHRRDEDGGQP
jgi:integrase